jgi:hypothetical protein
VRDGGHWIAFQGDVSAYYAHVNEVSLHSRTEVGNAKSLAPYAVKAGQSKYVDEYVTSDGQYIRLMNITMDDGCNDVCRDEGAVEGGYFVSGAASLPIPQPDEATVAADAAEEVVDAGGEAAVVEAAKEVVKETESDSARSAAHSETIEQKQSIDTREQGLGKRLSGWSIGAAVALVAFAAAVLATMTRIGARRKQTLKLPQQQQQRERRQQQQRGQQSHTPGAICIVGHTVSATPQEPRLVQELERRERATGEYGDSGADSSQHDGSPQRTRAKAAALL